MLPYITDEMWQAEFWIERTPGRNRILLAPRQIAAYNRRVITLLPERMVDLAAERTGLSRGKLLSLIPQSFPEGNLLVEGEVPTPCFWRQLAQEINLAGITENSTPGYGLMVKRSSLRRFPTALTVAEAGEPGQDLFQESALGVGEPLLLLHRSFSGNWLFVQAEYCRGWVRAGQVANCERNDWLSYQKSTSFLTVTGSSVRLSANPYTPQFSRLELGMGDRLPLFSDSRQPSTIDGQAVDGNYIVVLPYRHRCGQADFKATLVPRSRDLTSGYLSYTRENMISQAFKMLGERYSWGGSDGGRDCSSLIKDLFATFGFRLPRNSSDQARLPGRRIELTGCNLGQRRTWLSGLAPGSLLFFPGHVMLFLGEYDGRYYVISAVGSYGRRSDGVLEKVRVNGVVVNELTLLRPNGKVWLEELTVAVTIE